MTSIETPRCYPLRDIILISDRPSRLRRGYQVAVTIRLGVKKAPCEQPGYIHEWGSSPTFASARICTFQTYNSLSHTEESCSAYDTMPHNPQLLTPTPIPHPHTLRCEEHNPFQPLSHSKKSSKQASKQAAAPAVPSSVVVLFLKQSTFMQQ